VGSKDGRTAKMRYSFLRIAKKRTPTGAATPMAGVKVLRTVILKIACKIPRNKKSIHRGLSIRTVIGEVRYLAFALLL
jgi:hypothetical protein